MESCKMEKENNKTKHTKLHPPPPDKASGILSTIQRESRFHELQTPRPLPYLVSVAICCPFGSTKRLLSFHT